MAGRPLLFRQVRVGVGGETFEMVKFRTMRLDAESDGVARLATDGDPRVIPACRWVRATRADELPQILHIVTGQMSIVGPRPERPELTKGFEKEIAGYTRRHEVPPGLTGLAQIHGRYHTDAEYKLGYDLQYLVNWSPGARPRDHRPHHLGDRGPSRLTRLGTARMPSAGHGLSLAERL